MNTAITSTFGTRLADARKRKGLTGDQLGELIGVSKAMISDYETDKGRPKFVTFEALCSALKGVASPTWLVTGIEDEGGKVIDEKTYNLLLQLDDLPGVLKEFVLEAIKLAERTKGIVPDKFMQIPENGNWAEFHQYLQRLESLLPRRGSSDNDDNSSKDKT